MILTNQLDTYKKKEKKRKERKGGFRHNHSYGEEEQCSIFHWSLILLCSSLTLRIFECVLHACMYCFVHWEQWSSLRSCFRVFLSRMTTFVCFFFHQAVVYMLKHIASSNGGAIITGLLCLAILIGLKKVNERFKSKLPVPIPAELLVVMLSFWLFFLKILFR